MEFTRKKIAKFQDQNCLLTLQEAIDEFYTINSHLFSRPAPNTKWTELLVHHDVGHVFFGVNTSLLDEAAGDCWTMFGTNMTIKEYISYGKTPEGKQLIKQIGPKLLIKSSIYVLPLMAKIIALSLKMNRRWDLRGYQEHLNTPLGELRDSYNLKILDY